MPRDLWVEKYRAKTLEEYVCKDENLRAKIQTWVDAGELPGHMLFAGHQGSGKTTLALLLVNVFNVPKNDVLFINGSLEGRNIDTLRDKIFNFCQTYSFGGGLKYVILDEADYLNQHSVQPALRSFMEKYSDVVRFILTCNYEQRIIAPLHSRLQTIQFKTLDKTEYMTRGIQVLIDEEVEFSPDDIEVYVEHSYPDLRKFINLLQHNTQNGELKPLTDDSGVVADYLVDMARLIQDGEITQARRLVCSQATEEDYTDIYKYLYSNLDLFGEDDTEQDEALLTIARYLKNDAVVADREINLAAMFVELSRLKK